MPGSKQSEEPYVILLCQKDRTLIKIIIEDKDYCITF